MPDGQQEVAKLDRQLDLTCLRTVREHMWNLMKISDCEMQRISKPTIYCAFWNASYAGYLPYRRKGFIGQSQPNCFVHFIKPIIFRWWRDLFRIQAQNSLLAESRRTRVRDGILLEHSNKLVVDGLFERSLSRRESTIHLCSIWSIATIWNTVRFLIVFSTFLSRIYCLSFFLWLWRFDCLSDIWCAHRENRPAIPRSDAHEFIGRLRPRLTINSWGFHGSDRGVSPFRRKVESRVVGVHKSNQSSNQANEKFKNGTWLHDQQCALAPGEQITKETEDGILVSTAVSSLTVGLSLWFL
jgi:hypothetical protein